MGEMSGRTMPGKAGDVRRCWSPLISGATFFAEGTEDEQSPDREANALSATAALRWNEIRARMGARLGESWPLEAAEMLAAVAAHRDYWRPSEVRVLLLAESHVMTTWQEFTARVPLARFGHPQAPPEFVRLVYCLGYGERNAVQGGASKNIGTPQFWKILAACVGDLDGGSVLRRGESDWVRRVARKIALLERLKRRGVWLLDASPVALYWGSRKKPARKLLEAALVAGWEEHSRAVVRELSPRAVVFIGKTVFDVLGERVREVLPASTPIEWIYQPQAQVPTIDHQADLARLRGVVLREGAKET